MLQLLRIALFICFVSILHISHAQLPDGTIAPDFMVTDIEGNTHHLNSYLDDDKTVILEIGTTWCNPCWSYTQTNALNDINCWLGEEGLQNTVILFIEAEAANSINQIYGNLGITDNPYADLTLGDWTTAITYPIIDNSNLAALYEASFYPTLYRICPNTRTTTHFEVESSNTISQHTLSSNCTNPIIGHDVAIVHYAGNSTYCDLEYLFLPLKIVNLGTLPINSPTIQVKQNNDIFFSAPIYCSLQTFEQHIVDVGPLSLPLPIDLTFELLLEGDNSPSNNVTQTHIGSSPTAEGEMVHLELITDKYGFETYWELRDTDGNIYYKGGNEAVGIGNGGLPYLNASEGVGAYGEKQQINETFYLPTNTCLEFVLVDDYGDGICCAYGQGGYRLTDATGTVIAEGGNFTSYDHVFFSTTPELTNTLEITAQPISIFPNPASDFIYIELNKKQHQTYWIQVNNIQGQHILKQELHNSTNIIDISLLNNGTYFTTVFLEGTPIYTSKTTIIH